MDVDMLVYTVGALFIACITVGFLFWSIRTGQFKENQDLKNLPFKDDEEE